jgi:hypothetical protein
MPGIIVDLPARIVLERHRFAFLQQNQQFCCNFPNSARAMDAAGGGKSVVERWLTLCLEKIFSQPSC